MAPKTNGEWRPCHYYRLLNFASILDRHPILHLQNFAFGLFGAKIFSRIDLIRGYHQITVHPNDIKVAAITTPLCPWKFLRMPLGLQCRPILSEIYIDDVLAASRNVDEHLEHLRAVFNVLSCMD